MSLSQKKNVSSCDVCSCSSCVVAFFADKILRASLLKIQLGLQSWNNVSFICSLWLLTPVSAWFVKENCLEFNKLQWPKKATVHSLNIIFCMTANHKSAQCQNMCNLKTYSLSTVFVHHMLWKHSVFSASINFLA